MQQQVKTFGYFRKKITLVFARNKNNIVSVLYLRDLCGSRRFHLAAYAIAHYRFAVLFAYGKPHFGNFDVAHAVKHNKIFVAYALGVLVHVIILIVFF